MKHVRPVRDWPLIPRETAILVIDVQESELSAEALERQPEFARAVSGRMLPALSRLVEGAREHGCEIVYTVIEAFTSDGRDRSLDHKLSDILVPKGSPGARILPEAGLRDDDVLLPKTSSGVFNSTNLTYVLRNMGIRHVVATGVLTDQCVDMAVRDGADLGFYMVCAHDACATKTEARHEQALEAFGGYCRVQSVNEVLADLAASRASGRVSSDPAV